jgi:hypothetical protein
MTTYSEVLCGARTSDQCAVRIIGNRPCGDGKLDNCEWAKSAYKDTFSTCMQCIKQPLSRDPKGEATAEDLGF